MKKIKIALRVIIISASVIFLLYCMAEAVRFQTREKVTSCGYVMEPHLGQHKQKHGYTNEFYLTVRFDDIGIRTIRVDAPAYYEAYEHQRVCYTLMELNKPSLYVAVGDICSFIVVAVLVIWFLIWVFEIKFE